MYLIYICLIPGIVVLLFSLGKYFDLFKLFAHLPEYCCTRITLYSKLSVGMILFFLMGYLGILLVVALQVKINLLILTSLIMLGGALFVLMMILLKRQMLMMLRDVNFETIMALVSAIEFRDPYTRGHSEHVANLSVLIYQHLPPEEQQQINPDLLRIAGLLHDIGKIGISETILNKQGKLTEEEYAEIKKHTSIGQSILQNARNLNEISRWVCYHHERIDGGGYHGLTGDLIPFESKILSVADIFSALITSRSYRKQKTYQETIDIMKSLSGKALDEELVKIFLTIEPEALNGALPENINRFHIH